eukprot:scaffold8105_cov112-Isochrysis_galbana.AAC.6
MYDQRDLDCLVGLDTSGPSSQQSKVPPSRCLSLKEGSWLLLAPGPLPSAPHVLLARRERCTLGVATSAGAAGRSGVLPRVRPRVRDRAVDSPAPAGLPSAYRLRFFAPSGRVAEADMVATRFEARRTSVGAAAWPLSAGVHGVKGAALPRRANTSGDTTGAAVNPTVPGDGGARPHMTAQRIGMPMAGGEHGSSSGGSLTVSTASSEIPSRTSTSRPRERSEKRLRSIALLRQYSARFASGLWKRASTSSSMTWRAD